MKLQFLGAAETVTGSRTLIYYNNKRILVDCGLFQGPREVREKNWTLFPEAEKVDCVLLTHAHIDHSGYLPKLVKEGFSGPIICTEPTRDLCEIMLTDSAYLQEEDAKFARERGYSRHDPPKPLYRIADAKAAIQQLKTQALNEWVELYKGLSFRFIRSGHILGSAFIQFSYDNGHGVNLLTFSGDIGHNRQLVLRAPDTINETDYLVLEGTYGDRSHPKTDSATELAEVINHTFNKGGVLVIPSFAVGRTQELLGLIRKLELEKRIPSIPVYVDSPMAKNATDLYFKYPNELKFKVNGGSLEKPICPSCFRTVNSPDDSMLLCMKDDEPMIIISAAGMLSGGRILHHVKSRLPYEKNTILFVGYQAEGTKGRLLQSGIPKIRIHHEEVYVEAEIKTIESLSAHGDTNDIFEWLSHFQRLPKKIFLNHGELPALRALQYRLRYELNLPSEIVKQDQIVTLGS